MITLREQTAEALAQQEQNKKTGVLISFYFREIGLLLNFRLNISIGVIIVDSNIYSITGKQFFNFSGQFITYCRFILGIKVYNNIKIYKLLDTVFIESVHLHDSGIVWEKCFYLGLALKGIRIGPKVEYTETPAIATPVSS